MNRGRAIIITGPSGTGKTSICRELLEKLPRATWSISATTREPRHNETPGQSYEFLTREQFTKCRDQGDFLEWVEKLGHLYGTPLTPIRDAIEEGKYPVLEIDVLGAQQAAEKLPDSLRFFILPPTMETLKARLEGRHTESKIQQERRLAEADGEIAFARDSGIFQHIVTNDVLEDTTQEILDLINKEIQAQ